MGFSSFTKNILLIFHHRKKDNSHPTDTLLSQLSTLHSQNNLHSSTFLSQKKSTRLDKMFPYKYPLYNTAEIRALLPDLQEALTSFLGSKGIEFAILVRVLIRR